MLDLARKDIYTVAPPDDEKSKATKKEKGKSSGSNTKTCPIKNKKRTSGAKVKEEERHIVDPTTIDCKKAIMGFGK